MRIVGGVVVAALIAGLAWFGWAAQNTHATSTAGASVVAPEDVPARTMQAYVKAVVAAPPDCHMRWEVLAGFGAIESGNGTYHGDGQTRTIGADGTITPPIIGPPLDGGGFALVWDTDGGKYDGDTTYDRAVGPTQFLPSTWEAFEPGKDPQNVDAAADATMKKVCGDAGGPVDSSDNLTKATYSYNPSTDYVHQVMGRIGGYDQWAASNPTGTTVAPGPVAKVDEPALADIFRTMGDSGRRRWAQVGASLGRDGDSGVLDKAYNYVDPAVSAALDRLSQKEKAAAKTGAAPAIGGQAQRLVTTAQSWVGKDFHPGVLYQCAYFVREVLNEAGVKPDPWVTAQALDGYTGYEGTANGFGPDQGTAIRRIEDLQAGDIVMFANTYGDFAPGDITHVGFYVGNGQIVDRPSASSPVQLRSIATFSHFAGGIRLKGN